MRGTRITLAAVAEAAGVSKSVASYALNGRPGVSQERRTRIQRVAEELGYRADDSARSLARRRTGAVGLVITAPTGPLSSDHFGSGLVPGIVDHLTTSGVDLLVAFGQPSPDADALHRLTGRAAVDGLIVTDLLVDDPRRDLLDGGGLPWVPVFAAEEDGGVWVDAGHALDAMFEHVAAAGHRSVAVIAGPQQTRHHDAIGRQLQQAAGRASGVEVVRFRQVAAAAEIDFVAWRRSASCVVVTDDVLALDCRTEAERQGVSVPGQLSIIGFGDHWGRRAGRPDLATVGVDHRAAGVAAAQLLLHRLGHRTTDHDQPDSHVPAGSEPAGNAREGKVREGIAVAADRFVPGGSCGEAST
ncbi:LacI family DNA-binding transcriptional regulator [Microlunatus sp. Y2014]|uniref:LacI family DNA-binding transcriptional regulator n=1 Tax=Microlunatus sp. Y2014 TaxID=3418488 RepID=UPI003DA720CD